MSYPIPGAALDDRLAFVGTSGSGKTYAAGTAVERLLAATAKVVIVDPLDVWWGLRVKGNGRDAAFPVVIFGGAHADLPLNEHAGALVGEAVAGMTESCIVSLSTLGSKAAERRFMLAFLEALYRKATGEPFHLVFDEADLWAPQKSSEPQLQALMENIVRRGRVKGFIPWLITQRPAVLSKDVLSQADGLIAMKLTSSQDRDALGAWIEGQADRKDEKKMLARLPRLARGQGIVWLPGLPVLEEVTFPPKKTFDSSSTPKRGEARRVAELKPIDLGKLRGALAQIEADQSRQNAPARPAPSVEKPAAGGRVTIPDPDALRAAEERGRAQALQEGVRIGETRGYEKAVREAKAALGALKPAEPTLAALPSRPAPVVRKPSAPAASVGDAGGLPARERACLAAIAQHGQGVRRQQLTVLTGYKRSTRDAYIHRLKQRGLVIENGDRVCASSEGIAALGDSFERLPTGNALQDRMLATLPEGEGKILGILLASYPASVARDDFDKRLGFKRSTRDAYLLRLRVRELVEEAGRGEVRASDYLFDDGRAGGGNVKGRGE